MRFTFRYAALSDVGKVRKNNQDSGFAGSNLLVLADGMGGPAGGDIASSIAIDHLRHLNQSLPKDPHQALSEVVNAIEDAHQDLISMSNYKKELRGLGTTCITLRRCEDGSLALTHIGDSRAYLLRDGSLTQCTKDHTLVQQLVDNGQITPDEMKTHPMRSVLIRVLGDSKDPDGVELDLSASAKVQIGDRWLLCSDGLCGFVEGETITEVLTAHENPADACAELIELALKAGGPDNITCVVADIVEDGQSAVSETCYRAANLTNEETARRAEAEVQYLAGADTEDGSITVGAAATTRLHTLRQERETQIALNDQTVPISPRTIEELEAASEEDYPDTEPAVQTDTSEVPPEGEPDWEPPTQNDPPVLEDGSALPGLDQAEPYPTGTPGEYPMSNPEIPEYSTSTSYQEPKKPKSRWWSWLGAIILVLIALGGTCVALYFALSTPDNQHRSLSDEPSTSLVAVEKNYTPGSIFASFTA